MLVASWKIWYILLECSLLYTHPIIYPKCIDCRIQNTVKPNKLLSAMTLWIHGLHSGVMVYMLQFCLLKCYSQNFRGVGSICESNIFIKPDYEFVYFFTTEWNCLHHGWYLFFFCDVFLFLLFFWLYLNKLTNELLSWSKVFLQTLF